MKQLLIGGFSLFLIISCGPKAVVKEESADAEKPSFYHNAYALKENINIREKNSAKSAIVEKLSDGDAVYLLRNHKGWYEIQTEDGKHGWVRSDLVGPRSLSRTRMATAFVDSVLPAFSAQLYFDKKETYRVLYLTLADTYYRSKKTAQTQARKIGRAYQQRVYPEYIEMRILKPQSKDLFSAVNLSAIGIANLPLPILDAGYLISIKENKKAVKILVVVPESIENKLLLKMARSISAKYDYPFIKTEVIIRNRNKSGLCRLYFMEDKDGEDYRFESCE